jgi:hypothetical protein
MQPTRWPRQRDKDQPPVAEASDSFIPAPRIRL